MLQVVVPGGAVVFTCGDDKVVVPGDALVFTCGDVTGGGAR